MLTEGNGWKEEKKRNRNGDREAKHLAAGEQENYRANVVSMDRAFARVQQQISPAQPDDGHIWGDNIGSDCHQFADSDGDDGTGDKEKKMLENEQQHSLLQSLFMPTTVFFFWQENHLLFLLGFSVQPQC